MVRDISSPLLAEIALGAETTLRTGGYNMLVLNSEADQSLDAEHIRLLERRRVDGVLISLASEQHPQTLVALSELSVPSGGHLFDAGLPCAGEANSAKYLASEASWTATDVATDVRGEFGFAQEYDRDVSSGRRGSSIAPVSNNLVLSYIGHHVLGLPRSD